MDRAKREGKQVGRPKVEDSGDFKERLAAIVPCIRDGGISIRAAAKELGVSSRTLRRRLDEENNDGRKGVA